MRYLLFLCISVFCFSCKKQDAFIAATASAYQPLKVGSVYLYHADSMVTKPNSTVFEKHSYHLKDSIESQYADQTGNISFRIYRYQRDTLDLTPWKFLYAYTITQKGDNIEMIENNLRFIKLVSPVSENTAWQGNIYIDTKSPNSSYRFMNNWNYTYLNIDKAFTVRKGMIPHTITVLHADETDPNEPFSPTLAFHEKNYSVEVYAKNIGLIYKDYIHWTWQLNPNPTFSTDSYGIRLSLIDHKP